MYVCACWWLYELWKIVSWWMWVLGTELASFRKSASSLNCWIIHPAQYKNFRTLKTFSIYWQLYKKKRICIHGSITQLCFAVLDYFGFFFFEADRATTFSDQIFNHVCGGKNHHTHHPSLSVYTHKSYVYNFEFLLIFIYMYVCTSLCINVYMCTDTYGD